MTPKHWLEVGVYVPLWHVIAIVVVSIVVWAIFCPKE